MDSGEWTKLIAYVNTFESYTKLAKCILRNGMAIASLDLLEKITRDIGVLYPHMVRDIWTYFYSVTEGASHLT